MFLGPHDQHRQWCRGLSIILLATTEDACPRVQHPSCLTTAMDFVVSPKTFRASVATAERLLPPSSPCKAEAEADGKSLETWRSKPVLLQELPESDLFSRGLAISLRGIPTQSGTKSLTKTPPCLRLHGDGAAKAGAGAASAWSTLGLCRARSGLSLVSVTKSSPKRVCACVSLCTRREEPRTALQSSRRL